MTHPERVYSREQLLDHVWGTNVYVEDRTLMYTFDVYVRRSQNMVMIVLSRPYAVGYRFSSR